MSTLRLISAWLSLTLLHAQTPSNDSPAQENSAPPAIAAWGIVNAASRMPSSLPGGALAPGTRFLVHGWRMQPKDRVRIQIANGPNTVEADVLSVTEEELEAVVPDRVPEGAAELTVIRDGKASLPAHIRILSASFGIFSQNKLGWGPGEIFNSDRQPNTKEHAARPGERVTIVGSGSGSRRSVRPAIFIGGKQVVKIAKIRKSGTREGADEIQFTLPAGTPQGCFVPLRIAIDGTVSNTVTIAVSHRGAHCGDADGWMPKTMLESRPMAFFAFAHADVHLNLSRSSSTEYPIDAGHASFGTLGPETGSSLLSMAPPVGTCGTNARAWKLSSIASPLSAFDLGSAHPLDAGPNILVQGPADTRTLTPSGNRIGRYSALLGGILPVRIRKPGPLFLNPGTYEISVPGGSDVGAFQTSLDVPPPISWTDPPQVESVNRDHGVTVQWRASRQADRVLIIAMNTDLESGATGLSLCAEDASVGSFHIPPDALANIPTGRSSQAIQPFSLLVVVELSVQPGVLAAPVRGLDGVWLVYASVVGRPVVFR